MIRKIEESRNGKIGALIGMIMLVLLSLVLGVRGTADAQEAGLSIGPAEIIPAPGPYKPAKEGGGEIEKGKTVYFKNVSGVTAPPVQGMDLRPSGLPPSQEILMPGHLR